MNSEPRRADGSVLHTFLAGQSLVDIAIQYGVSLAELTEANQLSQQSILFPGQKLIIPLKPKTPEPQIRPETHTVTTGDTLQSIATKYEISSTLLKKLNGLTDGAILFPGTILKLTSPKTETSEKTPENFPKHCLIHGYHRVQLGDQIARIAAFHGVSTQSVLTANNLGWNSIVSPGAKLVIPISHTPLNCPDLVPLGETSRAMAEKIVLVSDEALLQEIQTISALCLEMQRSGLQPELGNLSLVEELIRGIENVSSEGKTVLEILNAAGFQDYSVGAAKWEPSAWLWLHQIRSDSE